MRKLLDVFSKKESPEEKRLEEEIALLRASPLLDPVWYRETYADLRDTPIDVARHYLLHGAKEGRNPGPEFDTNQYLRINPDIARKGLNPLVYFIGTSGDTNNAPSARDYQSAAEDSNATIAHPLYTTTRTMAEPPEMHIISAHFNHDFYLKANPDVAAAATDPAYHYLVQGWKEGRDPCPWFSTNEYLEQNADVADAGINPFVHYIQAGKYEGRDPKPFFDFRYRIIKKQRDLESSISDMQSHFKLPSLTDLTLLLNELTRLRKSGALAIFLSVSHDLFSKHVGGIQRCILTESLCFQQNNYVHLHVFPVQSLPTINWTTQLHIFGIAVNGRELGYFSLSQIRDVFAFFHEMTPRVYAIHSILGHNHSDIMTLIKSFSPQRGVFWIHDYSALCTSYTLLRNDVESCGAPQINSLGCRVCRYGSTRNKQSSAHRELIDALRPVLMSPSTTAAELWHHSYGGDQQIVIRPHISLKAKDLIPPHLSTIPPASTTRLAFLGHNNDHKGWSVFNELATRLIDDTRFEFYHFGVNRIDSSPVKFHKVIVSDDNFDAMINALQLLEIDVAIIWSLWPETFCFTAYEAIIAGAAIIAPQSSGNVCEIIKDTGAGAILKDELELYDYINSGLVSALARSNRPTVTYNVQRSRFSWDALSE